MERADTEMNFLEWILALVLEVEEDVVEGRGREVFEREIDTNYVDIAV